MSAVHTDLNISQKAATDKLTQAKTVFNKAAQQDAFPQEINLSKGHVIPKSSILKKLNPFVDTDGLLRVGGCMPSIEEPWEERHHIIAPRKHHIATLLVRHYRGQVAHQAGILQKVLSALLVCGCLNESLVSSVIHKCFICKRIRGTTEEQNTSSLLAKRVSRCLPFTNVALDVFSP